MLLTLGVVRAPKSGPRRGRIDAYWGALYVAHAEWFAWSVEHGSGWDVTQDVSSGVATLGALR